MRPVSVIIPVYRDAERARMAAFAILSQSLPDDSALELILVDDGSADGTVDALICMEPAVRVISLASNQGRSAARNAGAANASSECIIFMDCDCLPGEGFIASHLQQIYGGAAASCGHVTGSGTGFWSRFQDASSARRRRQHSAGMPYAGSSQNLAVSRRAFEAVGGFDTGYRAYGFEDRDLLIRLAKRGAVAWSTAAVQHMDRLSLTQIAAKMAEAGQHSSRRFSSMHPDAYRALRYAAIDARLHRPLAPLARVARPMARLCAGAFDRLGCEYWLPYALARFYVRCVSAGAYLGGTVRAT